MVQIIGFMSMAIGHHHLGPLVRGCAALVLTRQCLGSMHADLGRLLGLRPPLFHAVTLRDDPSSPTATHSHGYTAYSTLAMLFPSI
jgi:hypothetical protein